MLDYILKNKNIVIIVIYAYLLVTYIDEDDYFRMLTLTFFTGLLLCKLRNNVEGVENPDTDTAQDQDTAQDKEEKKIEDTNKEEKKIEYTDKEEKKIEDTDKEVKKIEDTNKEGKKIADTNKKVIGSVTIKNPLKNMEPMGPYDGLCISGLEKNNNLKLLTSKEVKTYFGSPGPEKDVLSGEGEPDGPSVDGSEDSPHRLSMFANNKVSVGCCLESPFSSSNGCVCLTEKQKSFIQNRGISSP